MLWGRAVLPEPRGEIQSPATADVVLTFNPKGEVWVDATKSPKNLSDCLEKAVSVKHPDSIKYGMSELTIEIGH